MDEYIDREALYEKAYWHGEHPDVGNPFPDGVDAIDIEDVDAIPSSDVAPVRHGQWIMGTGENGLQRGYRECSRCGEIVKYGYSLYGVHNFCNYCGAKMDSDDNA